jgi:hypothetical protein
MDKKKIARLFVDSFKTDIKEVILEGELKGCGGTVEGRKRYEVIFGNYATYQKREFSNDYRDFAKKLGEVYGVDWHEIKKPIDERGRYKSFYYQWDPDQIIEVDGVKFRMGRKMMNMPHAVLDGCSHTFYIDIDDRELAEEISALHEKAVADKERARKDAFPGRVEKAKTECGDMIDVLTKIINGGLDIDDEDMSRIHDAHFQVCKMLSCSL